MVRHLFVSLQLVYRSYREGIWCYQKLSRGSEHNQFQILQAWFPNLSVTPSEVSSSIVLFSSLKQNSLTNNSCFPSSGSNMHSCMPHSVDMSTWKLSLSLIRNSHRMCSIKKLFLELQQNSQENTCARLYFLKKKRLWDRYCPEEFAKF